MKKTPKEDYELLYESLLQLKSVEECRKFMEDLCTVTELKAMGQRIEVAMYLREGMIYQDILKHTGASSATISRVRRSMLDNGAGGVMRDVIVREGLGTPEGPAGGRSRE